MGYRTKWTDRLKETLSANRVAMLHIAISVCLAVGIGAVITDVTAAGKGDLSAISNRVEAGFSHIGSEVADVADDLGDLGGVVNKLKDDAENTQDDLETVDTTVTNHTGEIATLGIRLTDAETKLETVIATPPEGYLTGNFSDYTLHAKASKAGNFTANVNLVYSTPIGVGNSTTYDGAIHAFYGSVNWSANDTREYACTPTCVNTTWGVSKVSFNIGTFALEASTEKAVPVTFGGLNSTYKPDFAYVEVYPVLKSA